MVKCGFCRQSVEQEDGNLKWDTIWMTIFGCWLCHYCYTGYKLQEKEKNES